MRGGWRGCLCGDAFRWLLAVSYWLICRCSARVTSLGAELSRAASDDGPLIRTGTLENAFSPKGAHFEHTQHENALFRATVLSL